MKSVISLWLALALAASVGCAQGATTRSPAPEQIQIAGKEYVRLTDWTRANNFDIRWLKRDETLQINSSSTHLVLTIDSCEAHINGVEVWLLFPLAQRGGTVYIAQQDLQATLRPLLFPAKNRRTTPIKSICLDPGHGGKDPGYCVGSSEEKKYTLLLAQEVRQQLLRAGLKVSLTRTADATLDLPVRPELARRRGADLFVSLHFNAAPNLSVQGTEVYCITPAGACSTNARGEGGNTAACPGNQHNDKSLSFAWQMQRSLTDNLKTEDRGVRRARFLVLRDAVMPAILIEGGFMSHSMEGRKILDPTYRRQMARAIVDGVLAYKKQADPPVEIKTAKK